VIRCGTGRDVAGQTILAFNDAPGGLLVMVPDGTWQDVAARPGQPVVNLGDMMRRWTNDRWKSSLHRVINLPADRRRDGRRQSIGSFLHPNHDAETSCIETSCGDRRPARCPTIRAGDHMREKMRRRVDSRAGRGRLRFSISGSRTRTLESARPSGVVVAGRGREERVPGARRTRRRRNAPPLGRRRPLIFRLRSYLLAGILITAPIGITLWLTWGIITFFDSQVVPLIPPRYNPESYLPIPLPGLGLILAVVVLTLVGWLTAGLVGRWLVRLSEQFMASMPIVRSIYGAVKQIMETILAQNADAFRYVVLLEYPRRGIWTMGFVTGHTEGEVQNAIDTEMVNVFVPTTPNPTSGFLLFVPERDLHYLDMSSEEGFKMLVSTGIVAPPDGRSDEIRAVPQILAGKQTLAERDNAPATVLKPGRKRSP